MPNGVESARHLEGLGRKKKVRVGYAKLGRSMALNPAKWGEVGGDNEPPILLNKLARAMPEHEFVIMGRNDGTDPQDIGLPANVVNPWLGEWRDRLAAGLKIIRDNRIEVVRLLDEITLPTWVELDAIVVWAGQHGTTNSPLPMIGGRGITEPQISFVNYGSYIVRGISAWRDCDPHNRHEVWLCPDPRNYLKARDLKWPPPPVLGQYTFEKDEKHYRYDDPTDPAFFGCEWAEHNVWKARHKYLYSGLELSGLPTTYPEPPPWEERCRFGILINETKTGMRFNRLDVMRQWVLPLRPDWVFGKWTQPSLRKLGIGIQSIPWHLVPAQLRTARSTFTTPASGTGWATAKPWEAFAAGTVCFFHPRYDDQDNILGRPGFDDLRAWLRVTTPQELHERVDAVNSSRDTYTWLAGEQRRLLDVAIDEQQIIRMIRERL